MRTTLKKKAVVVREGFLEEVRFRLWSWLARDPVCPVQHPVLVGRPHRSVFLVGGPDHKPRGREEAPEWKKKRVSMARLEFGGVEPQLFTCSRPLQPSREETGKIEGFAVLGLWLGGYSAEKERSSPALPTVTLGAHCGLSPTARGWGRPSACLRESIWFLFSFVTVTNVTAKTEKGQRNIPPPGTNISSLPVRAASLMELDILGSLAQESFTGSSSLWGGHKGLGLWCQ